MSRKPRFSIGQRVKLQISGYYNSEAEIIGITGSMYNYRYDVVLREVINWDEKLTDINDSDLEIR